MLNAKANPRIIFPASFLWPKPCPSCIDSVIVVHPNMTIKIPTEQNIRINKNRLNYVLQIFQNQKPTW